MLIAIFALLLISVVAIALVVSSGTDSALTGNYRTSTSAYYAGLAGLEEARGRMLWRNPDFLNKTIANFVPLPGGAPMARDQVLYIKNPAGGEMVDPTNTANPATFPDNEYKAEFGHDPINPQFVNSVSNSGGVDGPLYKWVRITPATEQSLGIDVNQDSTIDNTTLVYFDPAHSTVLNGPMPSLIVTGSPPGTARQVFQITALAVLPNNTQKLLQYVVMPMAVGLYFHSALELPGSAVNFFGPTNRSFRFSGNDGTSGGPLPAALPSCTLTGATMAGIGLTTPAANINSVVTKIPPPPPPPPVFDYKNNYLGNNIGPPSVGTVFFNAVLSSPQSLFEMLEAVREDADKVITPDPMAGPATEADLPTAMSATNPMTVLVSGDLTINSNFTGYGLLVVEGNLTINADAGWKGVIMVVGTGNVTLAGPGTGSNYFDGAFFVAQIFDPTKPPRTLLPSPPPPPVPLGTVTFNGTGASGTGIYYNSCWINAAQLPTTFKVLSFREIPYSN